MSCCILSQFVQFVICCYLAVTGHCSDCCESVNHRLTAVNCDHEITTDNKLYKSMYVGFGAFYSVVTKLLCNIIITINYNAPSLGFCLPPTSPVTHLASCLSIINIDCTPLSVCTECGGLICPTPTDLRGHLYRPSFTVNVYVD